MKTVYINEKKKATKRRIKRIVKKIEKINKKEEVVIAICKELYDNEELIKELKQKKIAVLNGRWLFNFLIYDILEYEAGLRNTKLEMMNIAILVSKPNDIIVSQIIECAKKAKSLKIITDNIKGFSTLEETLYCDLGIAIQITNNRRKAISSDEVIINFDFSKDELNKYCFPKDSKVININCPIKNLSNNFEGILINNYKVTYNKELLDKTLQKEDFDEKVLYESFIYRRDTYSNIKKQLEKDEVQLVKLIS